MRFPHLAALVAALGLSGCLDDSPLQDTLMFPPGVDVQYQGKPAKLYGTSQCAQGQLSGHSCLIFPPNKPEASGVIISGKRAYEVQLSVRKDPRNPLTYLVEDQHGTLVIASTGRHDAHGNIDIRPVDLEN